MPRYRIWLDKLTAEVAEEAGDDGRTRRTIALGREDAWGKVETLLRCNEKELGDLKEVLEDPTFRSRRFRVIPFEGWSVRGGTREIHPYLFDRGGPLTLGLPLGEGEPRDVRYEEMKGLVSMAVRFVEARKIGMPLDEWCRREDLDLRLTRQRIEPDAHTKKQSHSL